MPAHYIPLQEHLRTLFPGHHPLPILFLRFFYLFRCFFAIVFRQFWELRWVFYMFWIPAVSTLIFSWQIWKFSTSICVDLGYTLIWNCLRRLTSFVDAFFCQDGQQTDFSSLRKSRGCIFFLCALESHVVYNWTFVMVSAQRGLRGLNLWWCPFFFEPPSPSPVWHSDLGTLRRPAPNRARKMRFIFLPTRQGITFFFTTQKFLF